MLIFAKGFPIAHNERWANRKFDTTNDDYLLSREEMDLFSRFCRTRMTVLIISATNLLLLLQSRDSIHDRSAQTDHVFSNFFTP